VNLIILTDGSKEFGFGHISRSQTLANFLIMSGHDIEVIILSNINLEALFVDKDVIIDVPYNGDFLFEKIDNSHKIIGLDYHGEAELDLVINIFDYSRYKGNNQISSLDYAIIRENVLNLIDKDRVRSESVLIMLGAYDINNFADDVIRFLDDKKIQTVIIEKEKSIDVSIYKYCTHYQNPENIAEIMHSSLWAISNGGSSMLELMALGMPIYVLPQTNAEKALANKIFKEGGLLGVGAPVLMPNIVTIKKVAKKAQNMIDGLGVKRILTLIEEIIE
jgi:spore coat polysaccharide biosynthesis predicted glycosyltransferase SpsG